MATPSLPKLDNLVSAIRENIDTKLQNTANGIMANINILQDDVNTKANDSSVVHTTGDETIEGTKTFTSTIVGDITGNAGTATKATQDASGNVITDTYATKLYVDNEISGIVNSAPETLDTLSELATALGNDPNFATTIATQIGTKADNASVVHTTGDETVAGTKTFSSNIVGNLTGNAATSTKLQTTRTINGTNFDGSANITTVQWGTARNISITDGTNTSSAVSVNGSQAYSLNLPSTIKATFVGNITGNVTGNCSGTAGDVAWANVSGKPSTYTPSSHTHDDRYYTEGEIDTKLDIKANDSSVVHTSNTETVSGTKTFTSTIVGDITGNAGTCKVRFINLVNNNDDLARVMNFTPPSLADVFNSWYRFSHANNYVQYNSSNAVGDALLDIEAWSYDSENNTIVNNRNTNTYVGFVSPDSYNKFTIKVEIAGIDFSNDDDSLSIIIAFMRDVNGIEHHISVVRDGGRNNEEYNNFNLVYDYNYTGFGGPKVALASGKDLITTQSGWQGHTALLYAERDGNKIIVKTTEMDSEDFTATLTYTLPENKGDLDEEDYRNIKYMLSNKCQIGFGLHSQEGQFKLLEMSNIFDDLNIFDAANDVIYEYINGSFVQTERKVSDELEDYTRVYNKNIKKEFIYYDGVAYES